MSGLAQGDGDLSQRQVGTRGNDARTPGERFLDRAEAFAATDAGNRKPAVTPPVVTAPHAFKTLGAAKTAGVAKRPGTFTRGVLVHCVVVDTTHGFASS